MDPNELLPGARVEFLKKFNKAVEETLPLSSDGLFKQADAAYSSAEQGLLLTACAVLRDRDSLKQQMSKTIDSLLTRSFQTTYNTFRPNTNLSAAGKKLSLVDSSALEDELLINDVSVRFRSEAEEQIRDLNIRIALLFGQETIKERENPFRPYMLSRCIASTVEDLKLDHAITTALIERLAYDFCRFVPGIYDSVNAYLADHGIAAELQFKIKKPSTAKSDHPADEDEVQAPILEEDDEIPESLPRQRHPGKAQGHLPQRQARFGSADDTRLQIGGHSYDLSSRALSSDVPKSKVEQLLDTVRSIATGRASPFMNEAARQVSNRYGLASGEQSSKQFGWLGQGEVMGGVLRKIFGNSASNTNTPQQMGSIAAPHSGSEMFPAPGSTYPSQSSAMVGGGFISAGMSGKSYAGGVADSIHHMQKMYAAAPEQMYDSNGAIRNLILEQRTALNNMTENLDEQMTIDVVAMLFEFILGDNQVPAEIRAQLGRLQFLVLKVALRDPTLLTQKGHPVRMLINRVGSISLGLKQIDPSGAHITSEICHIVETLLEDDKEGVQLFTRMLDELDNFIAKELRSSNTDVARAVEAVEQVQNRTLRQVHTTAQMSEALLNLQIDPYLREFLESTWVKAIGQAEEKDAKRARRYRLLVPDLLWSIIPKIKEEDRTQLFALLPIILNTLREGLNSIEWDPQLQQKLLDWLVDTHTHALRANPSSNNGHAPSLPSIHEHFDHFINGSTEPDNLPVNESTIASTQRILNQAIRDLDIKVQMLDRIMDEELPPETGKSTDSEQSELTPENIKERLRSGVSLEVKLGVKPSIGKLNWVDPSLNNLVLSLDGQEQPSMVSVRMLLRMISHGRVRFLETEPLFERAVQSLLTSADAVDKVAAVAA